MNLIGKKVVSIFDSKDTGLWVVERQWSSEFKTNEIDVQVRRYSTKTTTWFFGYRRTFREATDEEIQHGGRFDGSCPHKFIAYDRLVIKNDITPKQQKYSDADSWMVDCCEWCGLEQKNGQILEKPIRW